MIRSTDVFLDTSTFSAHFMVKYRERLENGLLFLRDETGDQTILKEWKSARTLLARYKALAVPFLGSPAEFGKVWIEVLPGGAGTPWTIEEDDYAQAHIRTRVCLVPTPGAWSFSGLERVILGVGLVNVIEHRTLCSEINLSEYPRTHLVVDVVRPNVDN